MIQKFSIKKIACMVLLISHVSSVAADPIAELNPEKVLAVVESLSRKIHEAYVDKSAGAAYIRALDAIDHGSELASITEPDVFQVAITDYLQAISPDGHLRVYGPETTQRLLRSSHYDEEHDGTGGDREEFVWTNQLNASTHLRMSSFPHGSAYETEAVDALINSVDRDQLILDLRGNSGGSASTVRQMLNCLLPPETPLYRVMVSYGAEKGVHEHASVSLAGCEMVASVPLVVLVDSDTASAAELLTLILKNRGRATVVGETTYGAGRPVELFELAEGFSAYIPISTIQDLVTGQMFELSGVPPDIPMKFSGDTH